MLELNFPESIEDGQSELARSASEIPRDFLKRLDGYIKDNLYRLTCDDAYRMYYHMFYSLRTLRSNSENFQGYSELLVFRVLWHLLGGAFVVDPDHSDLEWPLQFVGKDDRGVKLAQGTTWRNRRRPDIRIEVGNRLFAVAEIKIYPSTGEVAEAVQRLAGFHAMEPDARMLLLCYSLRPPVERTAAVLREAQAERSAFLQTAVLHEKRDPLVQVLDASLGLDRLVARGWTLALG